MPYDPRPVSQGGNRGAGELFTLRAPAGQFRVVGVDTFDGTDAVLGDYLTVEEALARAESATFLKQMFKTYVYDDNVYCLGSFGSF
jgi:hypothetical protein